MRRLVQCVAGIGVSGSIFLTGIFLLCGGLRSGSRGVAEVRDQIRRGHLTLYTFGLRHFDQSYDSATGLPLEGIAGCIVDDSIFRRTKDHNDYIENWIRQGNTPPNSLLAYNRRSVRRSQRYRRGVLSPSRLGNQSISTT